ncbi:hypothetical protein MAPG_06659 [Magnaporthiopsis poae ATCC 64411]|uniref:DUF202 domain-containing protein n=1 Tax=Magnaporthiopsis poae (strain ATCC 64411 / 73-15) TaxID=644358 RepID=A0A0C4E2L8_MAGP6|nr:hypothetical protein MAPG_06659 [Magnaporthiopsis poae ATCC 64411]
MSVASSSSSPPPPNLATGSALSRRRSQGDRPSVISPRISWSKQERLQEILEIGQARAERLQSRASEPSLPHLNDPGATGRMEPLLGRGGDGTGNEDEHGAAGSTRSRRDERRAPLNYQTAAAASAMSVNGNGRQDSRGGGGGGGKPTFLAWLRTSVSFASVGIAVTQLFRLSTSLNNGSDGGSPTESQEQLRKLGKPLGAAFLCISILILFLGYSRFVRGQKWIMVGKFPASRGTVILVTLLTFAAMIASLAIVLAFAPGGVD